MSAAIEQRNQDATCYIGNLEERVNEELLWELMVQAGPVVNVHMPKDKVSNKHIGYGFVEFRTEEDAEYAIKIMNMIKLYDKPIKVNKASQDKRQLDVGANVFIGNLDPDVDEKLLYDTFSAFGGILQSPKIMRDTDTSASKGYGFVSFESFEASDLAIECMNGQFLCNRAITVQYAYKKDGQGERHGTQSERLLAASISMNSGSKFKPHTMFAGSVGEVSPQSNTGGAGLSNMIGGTSGSMPSQYQMMPPAPTPYYPQGYANNNMPPPPPQQQQQQQQQQYHQQYHQQQYQDPNMMHMAGAGQNMQQQYYPNPYGMQPPPPPPAPGQ